ncbi:hypothetical protein [Acetobacteroides hydrogenigenes]|uniref:Uncharacterized protein n=1 Tax=Acetobacteroides hydrogenigenes TaxID=979970 RepID=A0A4V2RQ90_9BACT|nr:hypothetical protein [Acetobacteroides hydrogenigenes]TCN70620.1 hypothetical protein CLV25_103140 [Acetobacteroides hydrogenigenes]
MSISTIQTLITILSIYLFLRIYWIQASSASLINMMGIQKHHILNEVDFVNSIQIDRDTIIEALSYLNMVSKLYLNNSINFNMLKTFEGIMIKLLERDDVCLVYEKIFYEFRDVIKTAEPPYINLIYTVDILKRSNILLKKGFPCSLYALRVYPRLKKTAFHFNPGSSYKWQIASNIFLSKKSGVNF